MATRCRVKVVSNTGPLVSAFQCKGVDLLARYIETIFVAPTTVSECEAHGFGPQTQTLIERGWIVPVPLTADEMRLADGLSNRIAASPLTNDKTPANHRPEAQAVVLMRRANLGVLRILLEERAARQIAREEHIPLTGFIGVLLMACEERILTTDEMRKLLDECRSQGTRYSQALVDEVCQMCEELRK